MERLPEAQVFENVTITPNGKTAAVLEGRWDDIYITLINIRDDGVLVPHAHRPVDLKDGRIRVHIDLVPAVATPSSRVIPVKLQRKTKIPLPSRAALQATGLGLVAATGAAAVTGLVWVAITVVPAVISFIATWALPALVLGVIALGLGAAMETSHRKAATHEEEPSIYPPGYSPAEPTTPSRWRWGTKTESIKHHWLTGKPTGAEAEEAAAEAKAEAKDVEREQRRVKAETAPRHHWFTGKPIEDEEAIAEAKAEAKDVERELRHWWGGLTKEGKIAQQQEQFARLDPRAQQWVQDLRDPASKQAKGTYDDSAGRYCAVGLETHLHRRMTHQQMRRAFGHNFVYDVENYNDSTNATFEDVADFIVRELS